MNKHHHHRYHHKSQKKDYKEIAKLFFSNKTNLFLSILLGLLLIIFFSTIKDAFIIIFLIALSWVTKFYQRYMMVHLGIDFIILAIVTTSVAYGPLIGSIVGLISLFLATLWTCKFTPSVMMSFPMIIVIAFFAYAMRDANIIFLGIMLTVMYDLVLESIYLFVLGGRFHRAAIFVSTHILFNVWAFAMLAKPLLSIMTA